MLDALGHHVGFATFGSGRDKPDINLPFGHCFLYDPEGKSWPNGGILFGPIVKLGLPHEGNSWEKKWFQGNYSFHEGGVALPPRSLSEWREPVRVEKIWYLRRGLFEPDDNYYRHKFRRRMFPFVGPSIEVVVRRYGSFHRLDVEGGAVNISYRGILDP